MESTKNIGNISKENVVGRIHSRETFGAVDGPGIRYVLFVQGCALRCKYCHNPDTWCPSEGKEISAGEIVKEVQEYKNYIRNGGVTISGGEPLLQPEFVLAVLEGCKKYGFHTAVDTAGSVPIKKVRAVVDSADLILLDIKGLDNGLCKEITGSNNENAKKLLEYCESIKKPVWIRYVLVPQLTMQWELINSLADYISQFSCIEKTEFLPFHKMGEFKWKELGYENSLDKTQIPTKNEIEEVKNIFKNKGLSVL